MKINISRIVVCIVFHITLDIYAQKNDSINDKKLKIGILSGLSTMLNTNNVEINSLNIKYNFQLGINMSYRYKRSVISLEYGKTSFSGKINDSISVDCSSPYTALLYKYSLNNNKFYFPFELGIGFKQNRTQINLFNELNHIGKFYKSNFGYSMPLLVSYPFEIFKPSDSELRVSYDLPLKSSYDKFQHINYNQFSLVFLLKI